MIRDKILDRVEALPGVTVASLTDWVPLTLYAEDGGRVSGRVCATAA